MCFPDNTAFEIRDQARNDERRRQARVTGGMFGIDRAFKQFSPEYFAQRQKQFFDFALPGLMDRFRQSRDKNVFALARSGAIAPGGATSSSAINRMAQLRSTLDQSRQDLASQGFDFTNREKSALEGTRSGLVSELRATADPTASLNAANSAAQTFAQRPVSGPTVDLFTNLSAIGADAIRPPTDWRALTAGLQLTPRASTGGSVRVVA